MSACDLADLLPMALVWGGLAIGALGLAALPRPPRFLRRSRAPGMLACGAALLLVALGFALPDREHRAAPPRSHLDEILPAYQFCERHVTHVSAAPDAVYAALRAVTADEITFFQTLTYLRRFGRPGPESILNVPARTPILEVATRTSFLVLAEEAPREIVLGTLVLAPEGFRRPRPVTPQWLLTLSGPGYAKAMMNFRLEAAGGGTDLVTETRVYATDPLARRRFSRYWRVIYPGSAVIRRMWLRAIRLRAER